MDLVRIFACLCVSIVHFNATMSGWNQFGGFVYPNSIVPNYYLGGGFIWEVWVSACSSSSRGHP